MTKNALGSSVAGFALLACSLSGCAVIAVTDAVVTVAATTVKVGRISWAQRPMWPVPA